MFHESDEDEQYTVHEVDSKQTVAPQVEMAPPQPQPQQQQLQSEQPEEAEGAKNDAAATSSPLARYYRLGTQQRHVFDEHMRRLREEAQRSAREREFREQHPFRPVRETMTSSVRGAAASADRDDKLRVGMATTAAPEAPHTEAQKTVSSAATPVNPVFDRLAAQSVQLELRRRHREEQKRRAEAAALRDAFQPEINRHAPVYDNRLRHLDDVPVEERLLHYGETVARERQRRQEMKARDEAAALEAAQASMIGSSGAHPPDSEERRRLQAEFQKRNELFLAVKAQHRLQAEEAAAGAFPFQPQISPTSVALDDARRRELVQARKTELQELLNRSSDGALFTVSQADASLGCDASRRSDALYAQAVARQRQQSQSARQTQGASGLGSNTSHGSSSKNGSQRPAATRNEQEEGDGDTHQPQTNPTSDRWIANGLHRRFFEHDFVRRQALYEQVKEEEAALKAAAQSPGVGAAVTKSGGDDADKGAAASPRKINTKELNDRLYYSAKKASEVEQRRRAASLNARECPFRPELSPGTQYAMQRLKQTRDGDVVRRLTGAARTNPQKAVDIDPGKKDLYEPMPSAATSANVKAKPSSPRASTQVEREDSTPESAKTSPQKRVVTLTRDQVEHFYQRQMNFLQERQDFIQERRESEAVHELVECTFRPRTNNADRRRDGSSFPGTAGAAAAPEAQGPSVNHVTGVSGFLQRQRMARRRRAEHDELVRTMGLPRHKASAATMSTVSGTTLTDPFTFQTAQRPRRRRTSCIPLDRVPHTTTRAAKEKPCGVESPAWAHGLTSSARVLYDALTDSEEFPVTAAAAPFYPLPGYARSERSDNSVYFDDLVDYAGAAEAGVAEHEMMQGDEFEDMPRPSLRQVYPTRCAASRDAAHNKESLFSPLSPNTFSGRSLGAPTVAASAQSRFLGTSSALKGAEAAELTSSAQRRKQKRTVSFAVDGGASSPRAKGRSAITVHSHNDPMRQLSH